MEISELLTVQTITAEKERQSEISDPIDHLLVAVEVCGIYRMIDGTFKYSDKCDRCHYY